MMKIIKFYFLIFITYTVFALAFFRSGLLSNMIFFYRGIVLLILSLLVTIGLIYFANRKKKNWHTESIVAAGIIAYSLHMIFFVAVPVTIDRSVSIFLLKNIESHEQGVSRQVLEDNFVSGYVYANHAIDRRIYEQTVSKNIETSNDSIRLSSRGRGLLRVLDFVKSLYGI